ncbi:putative 3'-nucleotidase/nuclease [Leptomonas pyrrhocoris]|uniref:Putative 3'-nucleotidase/nuclease n=1 Tax=Leptomonas pyrrhocoris TaxID=157538 RepID=A0A0N0DSD9_LEPPY|nr:putative 3'-nucleotidase/nuclease [Leptomonas pyrrhocoris]XP_015654223.1 putative 3'-nucleotidase/nuclease [Leptomonas pyrrhocoris]KPA75783.1 putative 3'-nucleotidase/nuclease [Leptomonas pyrrhocoris]KPA75784.1 putative 3'-nucleotidase/nuclease [Leptomonas pyrrhocoris]|eukprot:XP_015654222.1 putative 3'-nucleotidase/nuclease [Leptomonas pyrrhocoris]
MAAVSALLRVLSVTLLLLVIAVAVPTHAWWGKGHMAVAEIARRNLKPDVQKKVEACASVLKTMGPFPSTTTMVEAAPWADDLKSLGLTTMATWHFIDQPYNPDNITMTINPIENVNVATVIPMLVTAVTDPKATTDSITTSIANLIHYVGDIHQPLHGSCLFSDKYPKGDAGGNAQSVIVDDKGTKQKLHAFWDSMAEGPQVDPPRPLSPATYAELQAFVDDLIANNIFTEAEKMNTNTTVMAMESLDMAIKYVYPGADNGAVLTQSYKDAAKVICHQRVTLAGYRLATVINNALENVPLSAILKSEKEIQEEVEVTQTGDTYNYYAISGVERGAAAGIFLSCFAIGCLLATAVMYAICFVRRSQPRGKKAEHTVAPAHDVDA